MTSKYEHKEYKKFNSSGNVPYTNEQFDMLKSDLMPKSNVGSLSNGKGHREYHYEYKEEKHPTGKYDRKDLHTVEEYTVPPKNKPKKKESSAYYYEREERELPSINTSSRTYNYESSSSPTPGYSRVKQTTSKATKDLSHNVEELDSLLDDLQKDQERQLYKSGYTSDTAESTSFDYRKGTPVKPSADSSFSVLKKEERMESSSWSRSPQPAPTRTVIREERTGGYTSDTAESYDYRRTLDKAPSSGYSTLKKEERLESSSWGASPPPVASSQELRQELYREEKHESRSMPVVVPAPLCAGCHQPANGTLSRSSTPMNKVTTTVKTYTYEVPADVDPTSVPIPAETTRREHTYLAEKNTSSSTRNVIPASPALGCQYCSHCSSRVTHVTSSPPPPPATTTVTNYRYTSDDRKDERIVYPAPANEIKVLPDGPTTYKFSETTYSSMNSTHAAPLPARPHTPSVQQPPKKLDDLLADFPEARFPTESEGLTQRSLKMTHESTAVSKSAPPVGTSKNVTGPPVYYPPGHTPFQGGEKSMSMQAGGAYASGRGMYEYEAGSKSKEKHTEKKTAVPVCLPLCCAMPCVIM